MVQITSQMSVPAVSSTAPTDITPGTFERWPLANQIAYIKANGTGDPKSVTLGSAPGATGIAVLTAPYGQEQGVTVFTRTANQSDPSGDRNAVSDRDLFGDYEGVEPYRPALDLPSNFNTAPGTLTPQDFSAWSSVIQRAYLHKNGSQTAGKQFELTIGPAGNQCTAFLSSMTTPARVYVVEALDKAAIMKMSDVDKSTLMGVSAFNAATGVAAKLNLVINRGGTGSLNEQIIKLKNEIDGAGQNGATAAMKDTFKAEYDLLLKSVPTSGIFSESEIMAKANQINDRWRKYSQFTYALFASQICTLDNNASITKMTAELERQEKLILAATQRIADVAGTATVPSLVKNLDLPGLIFTFQLATYQMSECNLRYQAEEMNQLNEFIKLVGVMQTGINNIIKSADPKSDSKISVSKAYGDDTAFRDSFNTAKSLFVGDYKHPLEKIYNITRAKDDLGDKTANQWGTYGQQLSDRANTLNQQSQVLMNKYNSDTKAKDRFYDMANTALSKMNDAIQKIANAA